MDLDLPTFKKIESFGWAAAVCVFFFFFGYIVVFFIIAYLVRKYYIQFKNSKLKLLDTTGKTVLITGCDSGFGHELARRLLDRGFGVFAGCLNIESEGATSLRQIDSDRLRVIPLDVSSDTSVANSLVLVSRECEESGLWGLVNNAGINLTGDAELTTMSQYLEIGNVNLYGMVRTCKVFLPLIRQAKGRIVNVTSVKGLLAVPSSAAYTVTKFGGEAFSDTLRQEMASFGVDVIVVEPGNFDGVNEGFNEAGITRATSLLEAQWEEASEEVKQFYGDAHLEKQLDDVQKAASTSHPSVEPVLKAFEDALRNVCPNTRYLVGGSNTHIDIYTALARISPFMPSKLFDKIRAYFFPYIVYK